MVASILSLALLSATAFAQYTPLTSRRYTYPGGVPYKVDTDPTDRGPQFGYAQCNSTTEGPNSDCQLALLNNAQDFCLWGPPNPNSTIGDEEAETVAWCTQPGHGTRVMPPGTITGLQVLKAPDYILFSGTINQQNININQNDGGGEMDPHGADERGNPLGGLVYTNGFGTNNKTFTQVIEWHNFMGSQVFCFKICDPTKSTSTPYCNNIFDRTGCSFVAPAAYAAGTFETCASDNQDPVGVYVTNGQTLTYQQPPEGVDITSLPSVKTPASSNCVTYNSADLFAAAASAAGSASGASSAAGSGTVTGKVSQSTGKAGSSPNAQAASGSSGASSSATGNAASRGVVVGLGAGPFVAIGASVLAGVAAVVYGL